MQKSKLLLPSIIVVIAIGALCALSYYQHRPSTIIGVAKERSEEPNEVLTLKRNGFHYDWVSNGNAKVDVFKTRSTKDGRGEDYSIFVNPEGKGIIVIRHNDRDVVFTPNINIYKIDSNGEISTQKAFSKGVFPPQFFDGGDAAPR